MYPERELIKALQAAGFDVTSTRGSHRRLKHPDGRATCATPANGRLDITPSGVVTVEAEGGTFSNAQCFTSLDGVSFIP